MPQEQESKKEIEAGSFNPFVSDDGSGTKTLSFKNIIGKKDVEPAQKEEPKEEEKTTAPKVDESTKTTPPATDDNPKVEDDDKTTPPTDKPTDDTVDSKPSDENKDGDKPSSTDSDNVGFEDTYYRVGLQMKKDGYIPEDLEIPEDATPDYVYQAFLKKGVEEIQKNKETYLNEVKSEFYQSLEKSGVTQNNLVYAMAIQNGQDLSTLNEQAMLDRYSSLDPEETPTETKIEVIKHGMLRKEIPEARVNKYIENLELGDQSDIDEEFSYYHSEFKTENTQWKEAQTRQAELNQKAEAEKIQKNREIISNIFSKSEIKGEPLSKTQLDSFHADLTEYKEVEIGGQKYSATEFEVFVHNLQNNLEDQLYLFKISKYRGEELEQIKEKAKSELADDWMGKSQSEVIKDERGKNINKNNKSKTGNLLGDKFKVGAKLA